LHEKLTTNNAEKCIIKLKVTFTVLLQGTDIIRQNQDKKTTHYFSNWEKIKKADFKNKAPHLTLPPL